MKHKSLKLARKFIESQGGFVSTQTPAELGYANCPVCGTYQNQRFTHCLKCGGEMVMPPNTRLHADGGQAGDQSGQESLPAAGKA